MASGTGFMKRLTRTPRLFACAIIGARASASAGRFHPWSDVKAPVSSGTKVHWWGRTCATYSISP